MIGQHYVQKNININVCDYTMVSLLSSKDDWWILLLLLLLLLPWLRVLTVTQLECLDRPILYTCSIHSVNNRAVVVVLYHGMLCHSPVVSPHLCYAALSPSLADRIKRCTPSVRPSVCLSVCPFRAYDLLEMESHKFDGDVTRTQQWEHIWCQRSRSLGMKVQKSLFVFIFWKVDRFTSTPKWSSAYCTTLSNTLDQSSYH